METYLVSYKTLRGEETMSKSMDNFNDLQLFMNDLRSKSMDNFNDLQLFMNDLMGFTFEAKVMKFANHLLVGTIEVYADTENNAWIKKS